MSRALRLLVLGAAAGVAAAWVMETTQSALTRISEKSGEPRSPETPATVKAANAMSKLTRGVPVPKAEQAAAGRKVHYATGAALGAVYMLIADRYSFITSGFGNLFGVAVSLLMDETLVPALKLSPPAGDVRLSRHLQGIAAHMSFGSVLEGARRVLSLAA